MSDTIQPAECQAPIRFVVLAEFRSSMQGNRRTFDLFVACNQVAAVRAHDPDPMKCSVQMASGPCYLVRGSSHEIAQYIFGGNVA